MNLCDVDGTSGAEREAEDKLDVKEGEAAGQAEEVGLEEGADLLESAPVFAGVVAILGKSIGGGVLDGLGGDLERTLDEDAEP